MRQVTAKIVFVIDEKEYIFKTCDFSQSVQEAIEDEAIEDKDDDIMEYIYCDRWEL